METTETILEATIKAGVEHFGGFPSGTMIAFAGKSVPDGWLLCNGALVSRTTYAKLFAAIGTAWGAGDGSTTFKLPDADGRVMQGVTDASKVGQYLKPGLPNVTGTFFAGYAKYTGTSSYQGIFYLGSKTTTGGVTQYEDSSVYSIHADAQRQNTLFNDTNTVQSAALQTLIIIKY